MLRPLVTWLRAVAPPAWAVLVFVFMYACVKGVYAWLDIAFGFPVARDLATAALILFATAGYAVFRTAFFHPWFRSDYRRWLEATPWTARKHLPLGPVHLVPQDVLTVAVLMLLLDDGPVPRWFVVFCFLLVYLAGMAICFALVGMSWTAFSIAMAAGLAVLLAGNVPLSLGTMALAYAIARVGLQQSLAIFPWEKQRQGYRWSLDENQRQQPLGWPFDLLHPQRPDESMGYRDAILFSVLVSWWSYVPAVHIPLQKDRLMLPVCALIVALFFAVVLRLLVYCLNYWPPINLWGRIWTFRWIVPGYDVVLVAPLVAILVGVALPALLLSVGVHPELALSITVSPVLLIGLTMGPPVDRWRLTARHRIGPFPLNKNRDMAEL